MAKKEKKYKSFVTASDVKRMKKETKNCWKWGKGGRKPALGLK